MSRLAAARTEFDTEVDSARSNYESKLIRNLAANNCSKIFKYVKHLREGGKIPSTTFHGSSKATSDVEKATMFNDYFHSVFTVSDFIQPSQNELPSCVPSLDSIEFTVSDVFGVLSTLDASKAMGIDGIGPQLLKSCATALCEPLHYLFKRSLAQQVLPSEWRLHSITPIR